LAYDLLMSALHLRSQNAVHGNINSSNVIFFPGRSFGTRFSRYSSAEGRRATNGLGFNSFNKSLGFCRNGISHLGLMRFLGYCIDNSNSRYAFLYQMPVDYFPLSRFGTRFSRYSSAEGRRATNGLGFNSFNKSLGFCWLTIS
jgi:hypothetical protein